MDNMDTRYYGSTIFTELSDEDLNEMARHGDRSNKYVENAIMYNIRPSSGSKIKVKHILAYEYITGLVNPNRKW